MTHIALVEKLDGKGVDWTEKVSDDEYAAGLEAEQIRTVTRRHTSGKEWR